jgi:hypothetical protein
MGHPVQLTTNTLSPTVLNFVMVGVRVAIFSGRLFPLLRLHSPPRRFRRDEAANDTRQAATIARRLLLNKGMQRGVQPDNAVSPWIASICCDAHALNPHRSATHRPPLRPAAARVMLCRSQCNNCDRNAFRVPRGARFFRGPMPAPPVGMRGSATLSG